MTGRSHSPAHRHVRHLTQTGPRSVPTGVRILLVESQRLFRQSLRILLEREPDVVTVIEGSNGRETYQLAMEHKPDIILLDVDIPDLDAESVTNTTHKHLPRTRIFLLARYEEDARIVASMQAGAFGYILKNTDCTDFLRIIRATAKDERVLPPVLPEQVVHTVPGTVHLAEKGTTLSLTSLTDRERDMLACAAAGRSNKEIADHLCVSVETVKTHLHHIYQKLSVDGRVEAILTYLQTR